MKHLSDADLALILRLLRHFAAVKWDSSKDKEMARKAGLLVRKIERIKGDEKESPTPKEAAPSRLSPLEMRREKFYNSLIPFVSEYGRDMVRDFYDYWSESDRSNTPKMRFEKQPTWETPRRLATWSRKSAEYGKPNKPSRLNQYREVARQLGILRDGTEKDDAVDEQ